MLESLFFLGCAGMLLSLRIYNWFPKNMLQDIRGILPLLLRGPLPLNQLSSARASLENSSVVISSIHFVVGVNTKMRVWSVPGLFVLRDSSSGLVCRHVKLHIYKWWWKKNCEFASLNCRIAHRTKTILDLYCFAWTISIKVSLIIIPFLKNRWFFFHTLQMFPSNVFNWTNPKTIGQIDFPALPCDLPFVSWRKRFLPRYYISECAHSQGPPKCNRHN